MSFVFKVCTAHKHGQVFVFMLGIISVIKEQCNVKFCSRQLNKGKAYPPVIKNAGSKENSYSQLSNRTLLLLCFAPLLLCTHWEGVIISRWEGSIKGETHS